MTKRKNEPDPGRPPLIPQKHGGALLPPAKKGEVRNPHGCPKSGRSVLKAYAELLDSEGATFEDQLANFRRVRGQWFCGADTMAISMLATAVNCAAKGQVSAASEITDRVEGKAKTNGKLELVGADGAPLLSKPVREMTEEELLAIRDRLSALAG